MRILFICDVLGEENNGTTIAAFNVIRFLKSKGHEVRILCCDQDKIGQEGIFVCPTLNAGPFNGYVKKNGVSLAIADKKVVEAAFKDIDLCHVMMPLILGRYCAKYAHEHNVPLTAGFHVQAENVLAHFFLMNVTFANTTLYKNFYSELYKYCDGIHYPTQFVRTTFEDIVGPTPGYVISNGVKDVFVKEKEEKLPEFKDKFVILTVGRYSKEKAQILLLKAVALSKYKDKIQVILAGEGPLEDKLILEGKKLPNPPIMKFFSHEEMSKIINMSDLYVHCAEIDLEAISCIEALSCGLVPVINNSPRSAVRNYALCLHNLFRHGSYKVLAQRIDYWIEHPEEKEKLSNRYLNFAKRFDFNTAMGKMEEMFEDIIQKKKK